MKHIIFWRDGMTDMSKGIQNLRLCLRRRIIASDFRIFADTR